jgi:hypothetical protein
MQAQVVLDTLVQRVGDAVAAAGFATLSGRLGPAGFAAAVTPLCVAWAVLGVDLGRRQQVCDRPQNAVLLAPRVCYHLVDT